MLSGILSRLAADARGFTLVETLVALVAGIVVLGAGYSLLEISLHQSTRISDVAEVTQTGRSTLTKVVDQLHSACVSSGFAPVREGSSPEKLVLRSAYSEAAEITGAATAKEGGREDIIEWKKENGELGSLYDTTYLSTEGTAPNFVIPHTEANMTKRRLGENIKRIAVEKTEPKKETQKLVFQYYEYATKSTTSTGEPSSTLADVTPEAGKSYKEAEAAKVSSVAVHFTQVPRDLKENIGQPADFTTQVTFAFSAPSTEAKIEAAPCE